MDDEQVIEACIPPQSIPASLQESGWKAGILQWLAQLSQDSLLTPALHGDCIPYTDERGLAMQFQ